MFLIVHYKRKIIIKTTGYKCANDFCNHCLKGNDCYSDYESAILRHLKTRNF